MKKSKIEYTERHGSILGGSVKCRHCGRTAKSSEATYRFAKNMNRPTGKKGYEEPPVQGPLCANCSEIPPSKMPWSRGKRPSVWW